MYVDRRRRVGIVMMIRRSRDGAIGVEDVLVSAAGKREQHSQLLQLGDLEEDQLFEQGEGQGKLRQLVQLFGGQEGVGAGHLQLAGEQKGVEEEGGVLKDVHAAPELVQLVGGEVGDDVVRLVLLVGGKGGHVSDQLLQLIGWEEKESH